MYIKSVIGIALVLLIFSSVPFIFSQGLSSASVVGVPDKLKINVSPTSLLADNCTYSCVFVQLQDSAGKPARAPEDTAISLSSSQTSVGMVESSIVIAKGETFASADFYSTFTPGSTAIAAAATGFSTVQSTLKTVAPVPTTVAIYGAPSTLPADNKTYNAIIVQLQDSSGLPAKAPRGGVKVTLSCSDSNVGEVTPNVVIPGGATYTTGSFTTNSTKAGKAILTTVAQGFTSKQLTITTTPTGDNPYQLKLFLGPPKIPADKDSYNYVTIQLQNSTGYPATSPSDTLVSLSSSDLAIGKVNSQVTIPAGQTYATVTLSTTFKSGSTTLTAAATDLLRNQQTITTSGFVPSRLAVFCVPSVLPADKAVYNSVTVQLQDSQGRPAKDPETDVYLNLFSSDPSITAVSSALVIPFGQTQATGTLTVTNTPGSSAITAQASSYTTGQASVVTQLIDFLPLNITVSADPQSVNNGGKASVTAYVTAEGSTVTGASVKFSSDNGGSFSSTTDRGNGYYTATFTAPSFTKTTTCTITANASKSGYGDAQAATQITVQPTATPTSQPTSQPSSSQAPNSSTNSTPTATPSTVGINGIRLLVQDSNGNPVSDATVASTIQPQGTKTLLGSTNATGHIVFQNLTAGRYAFNITKEGYQQTIQSIDYKGTSLSMSLQLSSENQVAQSSNDSMLTVAVVAAVAVVAVVICTVILLKRRSRRLDSES